MVRNQIIPPGTSSWIPLMKGSSPSISTGMSLLSIEPPNALPACPGKKPLGKTCFDVFHTNICENNCALRQTFESGKSVFNATAHIIDNKGRRVPVRLSAAVLKDENGLVIGGVEPSRTSGK